MLQKNELQQIHNLCFYRILKSLIKSFENYYINSDIYSYVAFKHQKEKKELNKLGYINFNTKKQKRSFWMFCQSLDEKFTLSFDEKKWNISFYDSTDTF